jgi:transposase
MVGRDLLCSRLMSTTKPQPRLSWREWRRRRAWDLHQQGWTQQHIAQALAVTQGAVSQWLHQARLQEVAALRDHPAPGATPLLTEDQLALLVALLLEGAAASGFRGDVWTSKRVSQLIKEQFGVSYHPGHVRRLLGQLGFSPQRPIVRATQRDEQAIETWPAERWPALKKRRCMKAALLSG